MFFGILFNAFTALGEISQMYAQRPIIVLLHFAISLIQSKSISHKLFIVRQRMRLPRSSLTFLSNSYLLRFLTWYCIS